MLSLGDVVSKRPKSTVFICFTVVLGRWHAGSHSAFRGQIRQRGVIRAAVGSTYIEGSDPYYREAVQTHVKNCFGFLGVVTRHSDVTEVVVGFARTGDGHNHRQGAAFARAEM